MPDRMVDDTKASDRQLMQSYQSVWMSRWKRTICNSTTKAHNGSSNTVQKMELDYTMGEDNSANKLNVSRSVERHEEVETKTFEIVNESLSISSESLRKEGMELQDLPMASPANCGSGFLFKLDQDTDDMKTSRCASAYNSDLVKAVGCKTEIQFPGILASNDIFLKTCEYRDEGTSKNPPEWIQSHPSKRLLESFAKSSSDAVPFIFEREHSQFDKGKTSVPSFIGGFAIISSNKLTDSNLRLGEHEYQHNHEVDSHSRPRNSVTLCFRESSTSSLYDSPSVSSHHLSALGREWFQMQKVSGFRLFPSQFNTSEKTEVKKSIYDRYSLQKVPKCKHNVETMRICTTVDSVLDPEGGRPRFCQATHSLLITKKTDVNLENNIFQSSSILGDTSCDLCNLSPLYGQGKRGLKIQSLSNFTNSEGKGKYVKDPEVTAKNESSVEEKDPLSGAISTPSKKAINMDCNSSHQTSIASPKQAQIKRPNTEPPEINLDLPPLPATVTSSENGGPLSSRTQSLQMDMLLTHTEQPKQQSSPCLDSYPVANPGNRCVKRLKLSSSHSAAQGTNNSCTVEPSFQETLKTNFGTICRNAVISLEPTLTKSRGKEQYFSVNPSEKDKELLLSHAWIQRWQHNGSSGTKTKSSTVMFCDPRTSNLTLKGLQNEQLPSIAAMALVGKAMSGFQPCELQKRGSFTLWNTRALRKHC